MMRGWIGHSKGISAPTKSTAYFDATDTTGRQAVATPIAPSPTAPIAEPQLLLPNGDVHKDGHMTPAMPCASSAP